MYKNFNDEELMPLIHKGNLQAFDEIYERYSSRMLHYFHKMLGGDEPKAQDFLQTLFLKLIEKSGRFKSSRNFSSWLYTMAHNMCKNEYRRTATLNRLAPELELTINSTINDIPDEHLEIKEFQSALMLALEKFESGHRSAFLLRYQEQLTIKEISDILNCSEGTVKSRLFYMTKKLADKLRDYHPKHLEV